MFRFPVPSTRYYLSTNNKAFTLIRKPEWVILKPAWGVLARKSEQVAKVITFFRFQPFSVIKGEISCT